MPDLGPETAAIASEEPVPAPHEGRLVGARLSANMLVGGVLVLMLVALVPFLFMKNSGAGRSESPAPNAPEAARWNGSNSQVSNGLVPLSRDTARANDSSPTGPTGNRLSGASNGMASGVASFQDAAAWNPPGAQPTPPASVPAADGGSPWSGQTPRSPAADATGSWGGGNRSGPWPNPSGAADTAANRATSAWGDPSQSVAAVPQGAPLTDPNRPVGPMMPTAPPVHNGIFEAARPAPAYQNNSSEPNAYTADARGGAALPPWGGGAAAGPSSYPNADAAGAGTAYPNAYSNPASNSLPPGSSQPNTLPSNGYPPNSYSPSNYPPSGYPTSANPTSGYPNRANPSSGFPSSANPSSGYPTNANPSSGYLATGYPTGVNPSSGYPATGYPTSANPSGGYPATGYPTSANPSGANPSGANPSGGYPSGGYPSGGYASNANPSSANPSNGYPSGGYPSTGYPSTGNLPSAYPSGNYPSNNANLPYPGPSSPAVNPMTNGAAGYNGGPGDPARARFDGGIERPTIPGSYDNAQSSLH
jgi:hypothetical protein